MLSIEIVQEVPGSPGHFDNINSLQRALDVFFQGSIAQGNEDGILKYDDLSWFCRNPECHSTDLPNHKLTMHIAPRTLAVHLKRWRNIVTGSGQCQRVVVEHVSTQERGISHRDS